MEEGGWLEPPPLSGPPLNRPTGWRSKGGRKTKLLERPPPLPALPTPVSARDPLGIKLERRHALDAVLQNAAGKRGKF